MARRPEETWAGARGYTLRWGFVGIVCPTPFHSTLVRFEYSTEAACSRVTGRVDWFALLGIGGPLAHMNHAQVMLCWCSETHGEAIARR